MSKPTPTRVLFSRTLTGISHRVFVAFLALFIFTPVITAVYSITRAGTTTNSTAVAAAPATLNFQARLLNANGAIVADGNYHVEFKLYNVSTAGTAEWTETRTTGNLVQVKAGYLSVNLGSVTAFPGTIDWTQQHWLTMNIGGNAGAASWDGEMTPRIQLTAVPYAFAATQAAKALTLEKNTGSFTGIVDFSTLTADRKYLLPDTSLATSASPGTICVYNGAASNCPAASGSAYYIQNDTVLQTQANFNMQARDSGVNGTVGAVIRGAANGQTVDLMQFQASNGTVLAGITAAGDLQVANSIDARTATTLNIGTSNATAVSISKSGITTTVNGALTVTEATTFNGNVSISGTNTLTVGTGATTLGGTLGVTGAATLSSTLSVTGAANLTGGATIRGLTIDTATATDDRIVTSVAGGGLARFDGTITNNDLTANRTWTLPDATGTFITTGNLTSINTVGTITAGTWNGAAITDAYVSDAITISSAGTVDWTALNNYPAACGAGQAITQLGDTVTCSSFATGTAGSYIQNQSGADQTADFRISGNGRANSFLAGTFDTAAAGALALGGTNANAVSISKSGVTTTINGALTVTEATTFNGNVSISGTNTLTVGTGATTLGGTLGVTGATTLSSTLSVTGAANLTGGATIRGLTVDTATATDDRIFTSVTPGGLARFDGTITSADLTAARAWTLPDVSGTFITTGNLTDINTVGTITAGTWNGSAITDAYISDAITISNAGTVDWTALTGYPAACAAGQAITQLGDTVTCGSFVAGSASNFIQNGTSLQSSASFNIDGTGRAAGGLQAPSLDAASAGVLTLGGTNATSITVQDNMNFNFAGTLSASVPTTANAPGYAVTVQGGTANGNTTGSVGGALNLNGGNAAGSGSNNGGAVNINGGTATSAGNGGAVNINGGTSPSGTNGSINITAGGTYSSGGDGGNIVIRAGDTNGGNGGTVNISAGCDQFGFACGSTTISGEGLNLSGGGSGINLQSGSVTIDYRGVMNASVEKIGATGDPTATLTVQGGINTVALATPSITSVTNTGTTGATTYTYRITALDGVGGETLASTAVSTTTGNATLSGTNYNVIHWTTMRGAVGYKIYRTAGGATQGYIGTVSTLYANASTAFSDTGIAASGSVPASNTTGGATFVGALRAPSLDTAAAGALALGGTNANAVNISKSGITTTVNGALTVTEATTFNGNVSISGTNTLTVGTGATTLGGTLGVTGATTLSSTLSVTGAANLTGGATIRGLTIDTATATDDRIVTSVASGGLARFDGTITNNDLTANRTWTLPDATGTFITTGNLTDINTVGTITAGTWNGSAITDAYISDAITISSAGTVDWTALNNYPAACAAGQAITQLGDTVTCSAFMTGSPTDFIQNQNSAQQAVGNFWISGTGRADTSFLAPSFDTAATGALALGGTNANAINIGNTTSSILTTVNGTMLVKSAVSNSASAFQIQNTAGTSVLNYDTVNNRLSLRAANDAATVSATDLFSSVAFPASGSGWTTNNPTTGSAATAQHTSGGGTTGIVPTPSVNPVTGTSYQLTLTISGRTTGSVNASFGSVGRSNLNSNTTYTIVARAQGTSALTFYPTTDFDGTITSVSFKTMTDLAVSFQTQNTAGTSKFELRTGNANTFLGSESGKVNTSGSANTAVGVWTLQNNTTGGNNDAFGDSTLYKNNTGGYNAAFGSSALRNNISGSNNAAFGYDALDGVTTGQKNTSIGVYSGYYAGDASTNNTFLGYASGAWDSNFNFNQVSNLQNATAIGYSSIVQASNSMVLGSVDLGTKVGIGITVPSNIFSVSPVDLNSTSVQATQSGTVVTANSAIFSAANVGEILVWADGTTNTITGYTNSTNVTVQNSASRASLSYFRTHHVGLQVTTAGDTYTQNGSTSAFSVRNSSGVSVLNIDTTNGVMNVAGNQTFAEGANRTVNVQGRTTNAAGNGLTISAGAAGAGASAFGGGTLTLQGGAAGGTGNANGGAVTIAGGAGVGTGTQGLVNLSTTAFTSAAVQTFASAGTFSLTAGNVDAYSSLPITASVNGVYVTVPDPVQSVIGRVIYIAARSGSSDFTLRLNSTRTPIDIAMKQNSTATLIWNGTDWTAAGASSSTDLQSAYNNTLTSAGGAELVLNAPGGNADGFTIRNNGTTPISGGILEVQSSIGTNLFSVNNFGTELAANGGAETIATFGTDWTAGPVSATITQDNTTGHFVTGRYGVQVATTATINSGVRNNLSGSPIASTTYTVSFTAKSSTATAPIDVQYSPDGGTTLIPCSSYSTQTLSSTGWTKITCTITTTAASVTNPDLIIRQTDATSRSIYIDNLSFIRNDNTTQPSNVQIGGGINGGPITLFTLDRSSSPPVANGDTTYLGSMYYDTVTGRIQCYESDGWGACGSAPDNIITLTPEYTGAVLNGTGVGTMTADFCSNETGVLVVGTLCATHEVRNFYRWTSPQATSQTYSIYVNYKLPATFKTFNDDNTIKLTALTDSTTNGTVTYEVYRKNVIGNTVTQCGTTTTVTSVANTWQQVSANGNEATTCLWSGGDYVIFKINVTAKNNANVYVENLDFTYTNK